MGTEAKTTIWTRGFILAFLINTAQQTGQNMMTALVPRYTNSLGAAASIVGLVGGLFAATALLMRPVAGPSVDYFNKQKLYTGAIGVLVLSYLGFAISNNVGMVIAARLLQGCGMGFTGPLGMAIASESLPKDKIASGIGIYSLAM
ncbi:MAG: MFS transporter, partial [Atopobiaceae bacterium]|nr:MFS transporter [Atopobiaceae bacterium]